MIEERLEDLLERLERERDEADAHYNAALTALDRALVGVPEMPDPPPAYDSDKLPAVNAAWNILPSGPPAIDGSVKGRLRGFIWRLVGPALAQQQAFNAALVDHLNRNVTAHVEAQKAISSTIAVLRQHAERLAAVQSHLIRYLQTMTLYVDTRDRAVGGQIQVLNRGIDAITDDWLKRWESLQTWERRVEARNEPFIRAYEDLANKSSLAQQSALMLKRQVEQLAVRWETSARSAAAAGPASAGTAVEGSASSNASRDTLTSPALLPPSNGDVAPGIDLDAFKYVGFEDRFRGSTTDIRARLADYVAVFAGCQQVLDIGCGRGEFLDLLRANGIGARGIDINQAMVEVSRERGLTADCADALSFLRGLPDESLGGIIAVQVVEHLEPSYLMRFIDAAFQKLRPGAPLVLETLNPACWVAFFESYIRDVTHRWPLHPETLSYLVQASGFRTVDVQYRAPVPHADKLDRVVVPAATASSADPLVAELAEAINAHADKLNARLFTFMDYAVIARR